MTRMPKSVALFVSSVVAIAPLLTQSASAASFNISGASTTAQTLSAGQTGVVTNTGSLTLGGSTVPVTVTGNATITNSG